ncbi:BTAD domain-containing putative transcriptional regulator [Actinosynnema sp. NPDC059797]
MRFRLLGNVEAFLDGTPLALGHARQRTVLAVLLVEANRVVTVDELVDRVWADRPPRRARNTLYGYLHRLRGVLSAVEDVAVERASAGYVLTADPSAVDVHLFRDLVGRARTGPDERRMALLERALGLWRGEPFAGLDTPWLVAARGALERQRHNAELDHADLMLRHGRHAELTAVLPDRAAAHPLDERLAGQLVLALHLSGRTADALAHHELVRARLAEELGVDPGPELRRLHQRILTADPALVPPRPGGAAPSSLDQVLRLGVLGPVEVGGVAVADPGPRSVPAVSAVLAVLACEAPRPVPEERFAEALWDEPPADAPAVVRSCLDRVRDLLGDHGAALVATADGHRLDVAPEAVDAHRFRALVARARDAADPAARRRLLGEALALWRGEPLAGAARGPLVRRLAALLAEERLTALEDRFEADLDLGRHREVVAELADAVAAHRDRVRLARALVPALHRSGRRDEAERLVRDLRDTPGGAALRQVHERLPADAAEPVPTPRQLLAPVGGFTAREDYLRALDDLLDGAGAAPVVVALVGAPGVGKTALALHWAHRVVDRFPDGQLHADLRGHSADDPVPTRVVLARFLRALGVDPQRVPEDEVERADLFRSLVAGRRLLLVLDNARSAEQVRPLLPGAAGCAVVLTSRDELVGLATRDGARVVPVLPLPERDALELLRRVVGPARVADEPGAAARLVGLCGGLPLALRIAAHRAARRPSVGLADLADRLADEARRLDLLSESDDPSATVRAVFSWSYRVLPPTAALVFRSLGALPGPDFDADTAAVAADLPVEDARRALALLVSGHLLEESGLDRFRPHDLLRAYAVEQAGAEERDRAAVRVLDRYVDRATAAARAVETGGTGAGGFPDHAAAVAWLDAEWPALVAACRFAAEAGLHEHAWRLPHALWRHMFTRGLVDDWVATHLVGLASARVLGDRRAEAELLNSLGTAHYTARRHDTALEHYQRAFALREELGDRTGVVRTLTNTAIVHYLAGRYRDAVEQGERVLRLRRGLDDPLGDLVAHNAVAGFHLRLGHDAEALEHCLLAQALADELGHRFSRAATTLNLGHVHDRLGDLDRALGHHRDALDRFRELGDQRHEGECRCGLASVLRQLGRHEEAQAQSEVALAIADAVDDPRLRAGALLEFGELALATGRPRRALWYFRQAAQTDDRYHRARAHHGAARAECAAGDHAAAAPSWRAARAGYAELGVPDEADTTCPGCSAVTQNFA